MEDQLHNGPWGTRLRRYREAVGLTNEQATEIIAEGYPTSPMAVSRLETRETVPTQHRTRLIAVLACIVYGVHPEVMDLDTSELEVLNPARLARMVRAAERLRRSRTASSWTGATERDTSSLAGVA